MKFDSDDYDEQQKQVYMYVKSIWPQYDKDGTNYIEFDECRRLINEIIGPLVARDLVNPRDSFDSRDASLAGARDLFFDHEYRTIFSLMNITRDGKVSRGEVAQFIQYLAENKEEISAKSKYLLKLNETKD